MDIYDNKRYLDSVEKFCNDFPYWDKFHGKTIFLSGATGMIGSFLVDVVMRHNQKQPSEVRCRVIAAIRNPAMAEKRFRLWLDSTSFAIVEYDVRTSLGSLPWEPDYWIHAASTAHPVAYATEPINTILSNVLGTKHLLDRAAQNPGIRFLLLSSVEIYGENCGEKPAFQETDCGYLNCNALRAGYPEAKRVSEALCQAYKAEKNVDTVVIRLPRCYGPTMRMSDSKAAAQFIKKSVQRENIVLKSAGNQLYSYAHVFDAAMGILWVLTKGETGQAYNLADERSDIRLKELAQIAADCARTKVVFELPDETEKRGYSMASRAVLDSNKLRALGWSARYDIVSGIKETITILREIHEGSTR